MSVHFSLEQYRLILWIFIPIVALELDLGLSAEKYSLSLERWIES